MKTRAILLIILLLIPNMTKAETIQSPMEETAIFAGGCFWCMQKPFDKVDGVVSTVVGYTGGKVDNPTYEQVSAGGTGHIESIEIIYNPQKITYAQLLKVFWHNIDPLDSAGQFCDKGDQYRSAIFYRDEAQKKQAEQSTQETAKLLKAGIVTDLIEAAKFYPAEDYHQKYYKRNPIRYGFYRLNCGRDDRLEQLWENK